MKPALTYRLPKPRSVYDPEPEFDRDRVIWDARYRTGVMAALRNWRERQSRRTRPGSLRADLA